MSRPTVSRSRRQRRLYAGWRLSSFLVAVLLLAACGGAPAATTTTGATTVPPAPRRAPPPNNWPTSRNSASASRAIWSTASMIS